MVWDELYLGAAEMAADCGLCLYYQFLGQYLLLTYISTSKIVLVKIYNTYDSDLSDKVTATTKQF